MSDAERPHGTSFKVLKRRDFAIFWSAAFISNTGSWMQTIAVPFVVYHMTHSTTWLGVAAFMSFIPGMISGPFGGSYADRHNRKRILWVTQTLMMLSSFALWAVYSSGAATPGIIVGITFVTGFVGGVNITTWQAFVTQLVDEDELVDAVRLNSMQFMGARAVGPAIAGIILQTMGASAAFFFNAISFVLVLGALFLIHPREQVYSEDSTHVLLHLREGWRFVRAHTAVALPIVMIGMVSLLGTSVIQLAPAMAKEEFHVGRGAYGLLVAAFGGGAITGSVVIALIADRYRRSFTAKIGGVGMSLGVIGLGLAPKYWFGVAAMYVMGLTYLFLATSLNTAVQARVEDEFRARVMAIYLSSLLLGVPLGALIEGKLASLTDLRIVIVGAGACLGLFIVFVWVRYRRLAPLDEDLIPMPTDPLLQGQPMIAERIEMFVDTHVHVISPDLQRFPLQPPGVNTGPWWETHPCSADLLRLLMADAGVDRAVLVQGVGAYGFDNEYTLAASTAAPEAFTSVVCTDRRADDAAGTLRDLVQRGARGYRWFMVHDDARLDEPRALWGALGDVGVPVVMTFLADRLEDFAAAVPTLPSSLQFAVDHCAFADLAQGIPDELAALGAFANVYLKVSTHALRSAAKGGDPADAVAELAARFEGRIMWGSDFSQTHDVPYPELVEEGRRAAAKLDDDHRAAYFAGSAVTLWPELQA